MSSYPNDTGPTGPERAKRAPVAPAGSRFRVALAAYYATVIAGTLSMMVATRMADGLLTSVALGLLMLSRRFSSTGSNLVQLGTSQTLLRYVGMHADEPATKRRYVAFAAWAWVALLAICLPITIAYQELLAGWWFPDTSAGGAMAVWSVLLMFSIMAIYIAHSLLLAEQRMVWAGLVAGMENGGFMLGLLLVLRSESTPLNLVAYQAVGATVLSAAVVLWYCLGPGRPRGGAAASWRTIRGDFVTYGLPRGIITGLDMSVLVIGPWLLRSDPQDAGNLLLALTLLRIVQSLVGPVTKLTSALTARFVGSGDERSIERAVRMLFGVALVGSVLFMAVLVPWRRYLIASWLTKDETIQGTWVHFSVLCWGVLPLTVFYALRGVIEVRWKTPYNLYTLAAAIGVHIVGYYAFARYMPPGPAVRASLMASLWVMGLLTMVWTRQYLRPVSYWGLPQLALIGAAIFAVNLWGAGVRGAAGPAASAAAAASGVAVLVRSARCPFIADLRVWLLRRR
ncbi:MAG TPA: MATE family efflux transporter [Armatimonadota bacterium]|nr:MATE family efflux transporter [Armatimonadota bacterium]